MADPNPFEDVERAISKTLERQLEVVRELDGMEADVTSWEADFIQSVLLQLQDKRPMTQKQIDVIHRMCNQYEVECDL